MAFVVGAFLWCCSCQVDSTPTVAQVGHVQAKSLDEASGLIASRTHAGVYWAHNDGDDGHLYAIRGDGTVVSKINVKEKFKDWEDIAIDASGSLYLADLGNNSRSRKQTTVYRIKEPDPAAAKEVESAEEFRLTFPGKPFNCESLFILKDHGYVISKVPDGQRATMYRFPLTPGKKKHVLEEVLTLPIDVEVTAADVSADETRLAVLSDSALFVFQIDGRIEKAADATPRRFSIPAAQAEGCSFNAQGVLVIAESGDIFQVRLDGPTTR